MRDYSLLGPENAAAAAKGLASGKWYRSPVPRETLQALLQRRDGPAIRDTVLWLALLIGFGSGAYVLRGSWWCLPCFLCYGVLYGSATDSRWHECGHHSAFKTRWMNSAVYQLACFMIMREPEVWRWSHTRHHADTIIVGRDPEIQQPRPPSLLKVALNFLGLIAVPIAVKKLLIHASGRMLADEKTYVPETLWPKVARTARIWLAIHLAAIGAAILLRSWLPVLYVGVLPTMYGTWLQVYFGMTQHLGLAEDVLDHRLSARTCIMNPVFRFLYLNMNYHIEHHMFPMVPYHALPKLHEAMRHDTPEPCKSSLHAFAEVIAALIRQQRDPGYTIERPLPSGASPYAPAAAVAVPAE